MQRVLGNVAHHTTKCLLYVLNVGTVHAGILGTHPVLFATSLCIIIAGQVVHMHRVLEEVAHYTIKSLLYFLNVGTVHAGILGAHAVLFATSLCIIIVDLIEGNDVFTQWYTYSVS